MKFYLVTDDADACVGMRLAGVDSALVHDASEAASAIEKAVDNAEIGLLFVTSNVKNWCADKIATLSAGTHPVVVEIPANAEVGKTGGAVADYLRTTVGISL